jgi:hypothetical protein
MVIKKVYNNNNNRTKKSRSNRSAHGSRGSSKSRRYVMGGGGFLNESIDSLSGGKGGEPRFTDPKNLKCVNNQMEFGTSCITWFTVIVFMVLGGLLVIGIWSLFGGNIRGWFGRENFGNGALLAGTTPDLLDLRAPGFATTSMVDVANLTNQFYRENSPGIANPNIVSIPNRIVQKDYERIVNPLLPPERSYEETYGVPINIPSRGFSGGFQQVGMLYKQDVENPDRQIGNNSDPVILPLFGRPLYNGSKRWTYYTTNDKMAMVKLKLESNGRKCDMDQGCEEIYDGDTISVPPYNGVFKVSIYEYDKPRYIPVAY